MIETYYNDMKQVVELLQQDEQAARLLFNSKLHSQYAKAVSDASSPLSTFSFFFQELDEYLNNEGARKLGQATMEKLLWSYTDFQTEATKVIADEKRGLRS